MNEIVFDGYVGEVIRLRAERKKISPSDYVLSFFVKGCNAPARKKEKFFNKGAMHRADKNPAA